MTHIQTTSEKVGDESVVDIEKNALSSDSDIAEVTESESKQLSWWKKLVSMGVEERGVMPVPVEERTSDRFVNIFSIWFTMSVSPLACVYTNSVYVNMLTNLFCSIVTGMVGTLSFGLGLRDTTLITIFFSILCTLPVAYLSTLGPKTGLRQLIQARYSFG